MKDLSPLWQTEVLRYMKTFLHYGRQSVWVIWRLFSIMADRGFEQDEDLSLLWKTEGLTYMKTCLHYSRQSVGVFLSPLWQIEGLMIWRLVSIRRQRVWVRWRLASIMKTFLHYGRQRVWVIWRLFSIMADRGLELYEDFCPSLWQTEGLSEIWRLVSLLWQTEGLSYMKTCLYYGRQRVWAIWRLCLHYGRTEGLTYMKTCLHYGRQRGFDYL